MKDRDEENELREWFGERDITLRFANAGHPAEWIAVMIPDCGAGIGAGRTRVDAARDAKVRVEAPLWKRARGYGGTQVSRGGEVRVIGRASGIANEPKKVATEFGWRIGFIREPDERFGWYAFSDSGELLQHGIGKDWDDAKLSVVEDLHPPSNEDKAQL